MTIYTITPTTGGKLTTTDWTTIAEHNFDETDLVELLNISASCVDAAGVAADLNMSVFDSNDTEVIDGICPLNLTISSKDGIIVCPYLGLPYGYKLKAKASAANRISAWCSGRRTTQS